VSAAHSIRIARLVATCALALTLGAGTAAAQRPAGRPVPAQPLSPAMQDSFNMVMGAMGPMFGNMFGNMMTSMFEGMLVVLERPETAERMAAFTRNYYEALVRRGFTREEALRIVATVGIPPMGGMR